jgi:rapamycin-insensitive companion of mTOR
VRDFVQYATWSNWFSRSLLRDNKHAVEKEQVVKLVRAVVEVGTLRDSGARSGTGVIPLSETVMRAVIAVAEHADDPFRPIFIQTLAEIGIFFNICTPNNGLFQVSGH